MGSQAAPCSPAAPDIETGCEVAPNEGGEQEKHSANCSWKLASCFCVAEDLSCSLPSLHSPFQCPRSTLRAHAIRGLYTCTPRMGGACTSCVTIDSGMKSKGCVSVAGTKPCQSPVCHDS